MGRETHKRAEQPLTEQERIRLNEARAVVAELAEREPAPEALTELGYEQRMARGRALELAAANNFGRNSEETVKIAGQFYEFIWKGI